MKATCSIYSSTPGGPCTQLAGGKEPAKDFDNDCTVLETGCGASVSVVSMATISHVFGSASQNRLGRILDWTEITQEVREVTEDVK